MNVINYSLAILLRNQSLQEVSITREGDEAILKEVVSPGLIAVNTCVDMMKRDCSNSIAMNSVVKCNVVDETVR